MFRSRTAGREGESQSKTIRYAASADLLVGKMVIVASADSGFGAVGAEAEGEWWSMLGKAYIRDRYIPLHSHAHLFPNTALRRVCLFETNAYTQMRSTGTH